MVGSKFCRNSGPPGIEFDTTGVKEAVFHVVLCVQELLKVFKEWGFKGEEKIPFSTLSQHTFLQDLMEVYSLCEYNVRWPREVNVLQLHKTHANRKSTVTTRNIFISLTADGTNAHNTNKERNTLQMLTTQPNKLYLNRIYFLVVL